MNIRSDLATEMTQDDSRVVFERAHENMRAADATAQAGAELIIRNAETIQEAVQSGAEMPYGWPSIRPPTSMPL